MIIAQISDMHIRPHGQLADLHHGEHLLDALGLSRPREPPHPEAVGDVLAHRHVGEERVGLEHHPHVAALDVRRLYPQPPGEWLLAVAQALG